MNATNPGTTRKPSGDRRYAWYALAFIAAVVSALALGVPAGTVSVLALALACPLMMLVMMRGMHGDGDGRQHH
ncbi:MAG: DUF2933 domain-containing protein [Streptomycetaceae bacterium]|nr:DUF2933 domain-containing protein [Streptomycetaceae bacterium]